MPGFDAMPEGTKTALTSVAYNYGAPAGECGRGRPSPATTTSLKAAIRGLKANPERRAREASLIGKGAAEGETTPLAFSVRPPGAPPPPPIPPQMSPPTAGGAAPPGFARPGGVPQPPGPPPQPQPPPPTPPDQPQQPPAMQNGQPLFPSRSSSLAARHADAPHRRRAGSPTCADGRSGGADAASAPQPPPGPTPGPQGLLLRCRRLSRLLPGGTASRPSACAHAGGGDGSPGWST